MKKNDLVKVISCDSQPEFIGEIGKVIKIRNDLVYVLDNNENIRVFKKEELSLNLVKGF